MTEERHVSRELLEKLGRIPEKPGVYTHRDSTGQIIYVGKAKSLRSRLRSYFQANRPVDAKTRVLMTKIADFDVIVTGSEAEALILENNMIKEYKPKYNILLKDDKTYPYIRVTNEEYPRVFSTRKVIRDGSKYFGPYTDLRYMSHLLKTVRSLFPLRSCDLPLTDETIAKGKYKVCLDFHIKKCLGPCEAHINREQYKTYIRQTLQILQGRTKDLERSLESEMAQFAESLEFERALEIRNRLEVLREYTAKQRVVASDEVDRDVIVCRVDGDDACAVVLSIRDGKLIGKRHFMLSGAASTSVGTILQSVVERFFMETDFVPPELVMGEEPDDAEILLPFLRSKRSGSVELTVPQRGDKKKLVSLAESNADFLIRDLHLQRAARETALPRGVASLQRDLRLQKPPRRIECFDNSHIQGVDYVASMVAFVDGKPRKSDYRKFKIKSFVGNDDFRAMREVVGRRYRRVLEEKLELPDLIIIDGGKGQLSSAVTVLEELGLIGKVPVIGLAKRLEEVFFPGQSESVMLPKTSTSLRLVQAIRDEAHRFAIEFHRQVRDARTLQTELTQIPGVGEKTAQKLLIELGSFQAVCEASTEELEKHTGKKVATAIREYLQSNPPEQTSGITVTEL